MIPGYSIPAAPDETHPVRMADDFWDEARLRHHLACRGCIPVHYVYGLTAVEKPRALAAGRSDDNANAEAAGSAAAVSPRQP